jgi:hypothetical protein
VDDETPAMESLTQEMRQAMAAWVADPKNELLKREFQALQRRYQRLFLDLKQGQRDGSVV